MFFFELCKTLSVFCQIFLEENWSRKRCACWRQKSAGAWKKPESFSEVQGIDGFFGKKNMEKPKSLSFSYNTRVVCFVKEGKDR